MRQRVNSKVRAARRWLFGPVPDLLFGCGVAYAAVFAIQCVAGPQLREVVPFAALTLAALLVSTPHYGATLLRVYDDADERSAHVRYALWGTLALGLLFCFGLRSVWVGSLVITLYLTWSPWHYTAQNYGVALMLLKRRGAEPSALAGRLLYASFVISFVLALVSLHGQATPPYTPDGITGYQFQVVTLGIPAALRDPILVVGALAWVSCSIGAIALLLRSASLRVVAPTLALVASQSLWFVLPAIARNWQLLPGVEPLGLEHAQYSFMWIALAHAAQYVWITASYAESTSRATGVGSFYLRALAVGSVAWTAPALLFAPGVLGKLPFDAGLGILVAAVVNLHHFMLDGVIWKLRDRRVADVLVRDSTVTAAAPGATARRPARALMGAFGALSLGVSAVSAFEQGIGAENSYERGDVARLERAERNLRWVGRASPELQLRIGLLHLRAGEFESAKQAFDESLRLHPTAAAWVAKGYVAAERGLFGDALVAYDSALALDPAHVEALYHSGFALTKVGRRAEGIARLEQAASLDPANAKVKNLLVALRGPG
jgi:hypothetical protein